MKKLLLFLATIVSAAVAQAKDSNPVVEVVYNGSTATVNIPDAVASEVTVSSGTSSHVVLSSTTNNVEIIYSLSGTSDDGEFCLEGDYKCGIDLNGLTLTNPSGPALNIQNGKRIEISAKSNTTNILADGADNDLNGCIYCTGHLEFKGSGILNVVGKAKHAIYSKEYMKMKNLTLNITGAKKDGIHCKEYFLMEGGTLNISNVGDDGIQCELAGETPTGELAEHKDEDSGNVYQEGGTLTIKDYGGKAIKADGAIYYRDGTQDFDTSDTVATGIHAVSTSNACGNAIIYDLSGRRVDAAYRGIYIRNGVKIVK